MSEAKAPMPGPDPGLLDADEASSIAEDFGVAESQVRRDHLISHVLAALSAAVSEDVIFFGGTALTRTHLTDLRLSEDIDLIAVGDRQLVAGFIQAAVSRSLRRSLGRPAFTPDLVDTRRSEPAVMSVADSRIQIQLLSQKGYPPWPTEWREIEQRYSDAPPARLTVLTAPAFAAAKLVAWNDRHASRDLYDMWAMAVNGIISSEAAELFSRHGPFTSPGAVSFASIPSEQAWTTDLAHQCRPQVTAKAAAEAVAAAWSSV
ncbi:nucleotidyl transferase AbiEii/AbiGii toxin family protein [Brevibacterium sp. 'Marine']|uniref:nucleotidyl transferase AbiEii/AbiGii toxin family protein n=1 Tax=Brevibacterium sp. 'Marine' TaxID=2725563 RepID=UPI001B7D0A8A|nr:nucleotidyl transferase AbiEii/AbiGii toxin family protein [Brevibacterium sp. 'Marine']